MLLLFLYVPIDEYNVSQSKKKEDDIYIILIEQEIRNKMRLKVEEMERHFIMSLPTASFP